MSKSKKKRLPKKNLNVSPEDGERILKIAAHRGLTIEGLFAQEDVRDFFRLLLIDEMKKELQKEGEEPKGNR